VLKKFKCVSTLVTNINAFPIVSKRLGALDPKQTLSGFSISLLGPSFVGANVRAMMQDLTGKPQNLSHDS